MKKIIFVALLIISAQFSFAQSVLGRWKTIDDETGKEKSIVEIFEKNGKVYGKVVKGFSANADTKICTKCTDDRKDQKMVGLEIIRGLVKDGNEWGDGEILDPEKGKIYDCKIWVEDGKLQVRGYVGFFFRTQTWIKE